MKQVIDYFQIVLIGILTFIAAAIGVILLPLGKGKALYLASQIWSRALIFICQTNLKVVEYHKTNWAIPRIIVSNHASNLDIPVLFLALPIPLFFVAKKELKNIPFMGWYMQLVGMIFIDRQNREKAVESMKKASVEIKNGKNILSFPEGTRSMDGKLALFKKGSFVIALEHNIEILPVALLGTQNGIPPRKFEINPANVEVHIGEAISPQSTGIRNAEELAEFTRKKIQLLMDANSSHIK